MIAAQWIGRRPYREAWRLQRARRQAVIDGIAPEVLWVLEHDPVVTTGRRAAGVDRALLAARGIEVVQTERGGLATYHGPGQVMGYVIVDIGRRNWSIRGVVEGIEQGLIGWLGCRGVVAGRRAGAPGVWVGKDKIAAVGLHVSRGVTMHGFALNLTTPAEAYVGFVPCGVADGGVTSLAVQTGQVCRVTDVAEDVGRTVVTAMLGGTGLTHDRAEISERR